MNELLCIVGPTATGKTKRAVREASKTPSILVSADSRQVYRGLDIVTGKDHPAGTKLYGIDLVSPDQECSVSHWYDAVIPHIQEAWGEEKQVIVVGGTGLYVRALTEGIATIKVPPDPALRHVLEPLSLFRLQAKLKKLSPLKFMAMNHSDQANPRRLIRAIEIARSSPPPTPILPPHRVTLIGLKCSDDSTYRARVRTRVVARLKAGAIKETKQLLREYEGNIQSMSAIGYRSLIKFIGGEYTQPEMIEAWICDELRYAKRQLTWFRKDKRIKWYDINS